MFFYISACEKKSSFYPRNVGSLGENILDRYSDKIFIEAHSFKKKKDEVN